MQGFDEWINRNLRRFPGGGKIAAMQNRLASFAEQGIQGVANVAVNILLARALVPDDFAAIGTMLGVHYFVLGMHRTAIVLPFILDASGTDDAVAVEGRWWWFNLLSLVVIAAILAVIAAATAQVAGDSPWLVQGIALTVLVSPPLLLFEFGRRVLYQRRLPATAALASTVYLLLNLGVAAAVLASRGGATPLLGAMAWVFAGIGGAATATWAAPPGRFDVAAGFRLWWANRSFAFWQAMTNIPYAVYNSSVVVFVGIFGGSGAAAAFTAARTLTNPAISMVTAVDSLDKPRAARALASEGLPGLFRSIGQTRKLLALITGTYLGALILFAEPLLTLAFGDRYVGQANAVRGLALVFFLICMNQPSETLLIVLRASRTLLVTRIIAAVVAIASLALAQPWGLIGACVALLATHALNLANLRVAERIAAGRWRTQTGDAASSEDRA